MGSISVACVAVCLLLAACGRKEEETAKAPEPVREWSMINSGEFVFLKTSARSKFDPAIEFMCLKAAKPTASIHFEEKSYSRHKLADLPDIPYEVVNMNGNNNFIRIGFQNIRFESVRVLGYVEVSGISYGGIAFNDIESAIAAPTVPVLEVKDPGSPMTAGHQYDLSNLRSLWPQFRTACIKA